MTPTTCLQKRKGHEASSDEGSSEAQIPTSNGCGLDGEQPRSSTEDILREDASVEAGAPRPNIQIGPMDEVVATLHNIHRAIENLAGLVAEQNRLWNEPNSDTVPPGEVNQKNQHPPQDDDTGSHVSLQAFFNLNPPSFSGDKSNEDPKFFIDRTYKICRELGCSSERSVELATFKLEGFALHWFESLASPPSTWDEFSKIFMARFLPRSVVHTKDRELRRLVKTPSMTVSEYDRRFLELSRCVPHFKHYTEQMRAQRFLEGLVEPMFLAISAISCPTYDSAVNYAKLIEGHDMQERNKSIIDGSDNGEGCSGSSEGFWYQGACYQCGEVSHMRRDCPRLG